MVVIKDEEIKQRIIEALKEQPGLTVENLAERIGVHRHTTAKYLLELKGAGKIRRRKIGTASLHYLTKEMDLQYLSKETVRLPEKAVTGKLKKIEERPVEEITPERKIVTESKKEAGEIVKKSFEEHLAEKLQKPLKPLQGPEKFGEVKRRIDRESYKRIFKYSVLSLSVTGAIVFVYFFGPQIMGSITGFTGFFIFEEPFDKVSGLFITGAGGALSENELNIYALLKSYGGNVSKARVSDMQELNLSEYDYMVVSIDAGAFVTDEICQLIADSKTPFMYSSRNFNSKCAEELHLAAGSLCGPNESPIWTVVNNSYYPTSHIGSVPQKVKIFTNEFSVGLCVAEHNGLYSNPIVLISRDQAHGYLVVFDDDLQKRAFFALPSHEFDLTDDGKTLIERTIKWLFSK